MKNNQIIKQYIKIIIKKYAKCRASVSSQRQTITFERLGYYITFMHSRKPFA